MVFGQNRQAEREIAARADAATRALEERRLREAAAEEASRLDGRHFTDWVPVLDELRAQKRDDESLELLARIIPVMEAAAAIRQDPSRPVGDWVAPGYYKRMAIIYRKRKDYAGEVAILERYHALVGWQATKLTERLAAARTLAAG